MTNTNDEYKKHLVDLTSAAAKAEGKSRVEPPDKAKKLHDFAEETKDNVRMVLKEYIAKTKEDDSNVS